MVTMEPPRRARVGPRESLTVTATEREVDGWRVASVIAGERLAEWAVGALNEAARAAIGARVTGLDRARPWWCCRPRSQTRQRPAQGAPSPKCWPQNWGSSNQRGGRGFSAASSASIIVPMVVFQLLLSRLGAW